MNLCLIAWKRGPASLPAKVEFFLPWYCKKVWGGIFSTDSVTLSSTSSICSLQNNIKLRVTILLYFCICQDTLKDNNQAWFHQTHSKQDTVITNSLTLFLPKKKKITPIFFSHLRVRNPCHPQTSVRSFKYYHLQWPKITGKVLIMFPFWVCLVFFSFFLNEWQVLAMLHYH